MDKKILNNFLRGLFEHNYFFNWSILQKKTFLNISELSQRIGVVPKFQYLCNINYYSEKNYYAIVKDIISQKHNDARLLTKVPSVPFSYYKFD